MVPTGRRRSRPRTSLFQGSALVAGALALVVAMPQTAHAHHRIGSEPTLPYAMPATPPMRGCQAIATTPTAPPTTTNDIQVIYAWHTGDGNNYESSYQTIARIVDRIDWMLDTSTNYDQHLRLSCRYTPNGTYADYARALVVPEQIEAGANPMTSSGTIRNDLWSAGYADSNRWYLVFADFESESDATLCFESGGCIAITELWDAGVAGHELFHTMGAGHTWMTENGEGFCPDPMYCWWDWWLVDGAFKNYYDPSELTANFFIDPYPDTRIWNIARSPTITRPTCCDVGVSSDMLTGHERTVEGGGTPPGGVPNGFGSLRGASIMVTPSCGRSGVSCRYFDGRKSLQVTTGSTQSSSGFRVLRRPAVTPGQTYKFYVRLRGDEARNVVVWFDFFNAVGHMGGWGQTKTLTSNWLEHSYSVAAPTGATNVEVSVRGSGTQSSFVFHVDSLQLSHCGSGCRPTF